MKFIPFNTQLIRLLSIFGVVVFLAALGIMAVIDSRAVRRDLATTMRNQVELSRVLLVEYVAEHREYIERLIAQLPLQAQGEEDLGAIIGLFDPGDVFCLLDRQGRVIAINEQYRELLGQDLSHLTYVRQKQPVSAVHRSLFRTVPVVTFTFPLAAGRLLMVEENLREVLARIRHVTSTLESETFLLILDQDNTIVFRVQKETAGDGRQAELEPSGGPDRYDLRSYRLEEEEIVCIERELSLPAGWTIYSCLSASQLVGAVWKSIALHVSLLAGGLIGLLLFLHLLIRSRISRPIGRLSRRLSELNPLSGEERLPPELAGRTLELVRIVEAVDEMGTRVRNANAELVKNEELFRLVSEFCLDWAYWLSPAGAITYIAPSCERITGYSPEEFYHRPALLVEIVHPDEQPDYRRHQEEAIATAAHEPLEFRILTRQGSVKWISHTCQTIYRDGECMGVRGSNADITARKEAEITLRASEERFRAVVEQAADGFFIHDLSGRILEVNQQACRMLGYERLELLGLTVHDVDRKMVPDQLRVFWRIMEAGQTYTIETESVRKDGSVFPTEVRISQVRWRDEQVILSLVRDISDRKRAEEALAQEKELLSVTLRSIGEGMVCTDPEGRIIIFNRMAERLTGWSEEEARGRRLREVLCLLPEAPREACLDPVAEVMATGRQVESKGRCRLRDRQGRELEVAGSSSPIFDRENRIMGVVAIFRDLTEQRNLEQEAAKAEKLESLGILAGGIAHDFNNLLTAVQGNISLARMYLGQESRAAGHLDSAEKAAMRTRDLTRQLLTFAQGGAPIKQTTSIAELINDTARFALRGSNVKLRFALPEDLWQAEVDPGQMSQVIANLVINADQAMPDGGVLEIGGENVEVAAGEIPQLRPGRYIRIWVRDQGIGIAAEHLRYIFDPYFTTKQKGSGLGLASSYSIVKRHEGSIAVESRVGEGTTFCLHLPASRRQPAVEPEDSDLPLLGQGRVLIMDDDEMVRELAGELLNHLGYEVEYAADGQEAVEKYAGALRAETPFSLVILDLTIPGGVGGREAVGSLLAIDPAAIVVVASGYSQDPVMQAPENYGFRDVLHKPFNIRELVKLLQRLTGPAG